MDHSPRAKPSNPEVFERQLEIDAADEDVSLVFGPQASDIEPESWQKARV